jgi:hypothetical protein
MITYLLRYDTADQAVEGVYLLSQASWRERLAVVLVDYRLQLGFNFNDMCQCILKQSSGSLNI